MKRIFSYFTLLFVSIYVFADVPGLVSGIQIPSPITNAQFNISWTAPSTGGIVVRYEVEREVAGQGWQVPGGSYSGSSFSNTDSLQTNLFRFQVRACNEEGCGQFTTTPQIQAAGPVVSSGETNCEPDGYCVRLRGSNLATSQTYVAIRELNLISGPQIFQGAGLTLGSDGAGQYLQFRVPNSVQALYETQGLYFYGVNHGQLMFSVPVSLQKPQVTNVPGLIANFQIPNPITNAAFAMSWSAPTTGGLTTIYEVQRNDSSAGWTTPGGTFNGASFNNVDSLQTGLAQFRVRACNTAGCGAYATSVQIQAAGPVVTSGETTCDPDGYCIRLRGSNLNTSQTYVGIREVNSTPGPHIFQGAGLTLGSDGNGQYLQFRVPVNMQSLFESQGLNFYGVNHGQLMFSVPVFLQKSVNSVVSLTITANPAANLIAPATTTLTSALSSTIGVTVVSYLVAGNPITCAGGVGPAPTYNCAWQAIAAGTYSVTARATANGQNYDSAPLSVTVAAGTTPSVSVIANPANGLIAPASTTLSATLANVANVSSVSYFNGANQIACPTTPVAPSYSCFWQGITAGTYSVTARAAVAGGSTVVSQPLSLVVADPISGVAATPPSPVLAQAPSAAEIAASDKVGASSGEFRVDEQGNSTFAMPIVSMPGIAGTSPKLSIAYNSGTGEGPLGLGFRIGGQSAIYRCRKTPEIDGIIPGAYPPITFTDTDSYCLDGQRLILIGAQPGSTTRFEFKTEIDSYQRIIAIDENASIAGFDTFYVYGKDGNISQYGGVFSAFGLSGSVGRLFANLGGEIIVPNVVQEWAMVALTDRSNNTIGFSYLTDHTIGQQLLSEVGFNGGDATFGPNSASATMMSSRPSPLTSNTCNTFSLYQALASGMLMPVLIVPAMSSVSFDASAGSTIIRIACKNKILPRSMNVNNSLRPSPSISASRTNFHCS